MLVQYFCPFFVWNVKYLWSGFCVSHPSHATKMSDLFDFAIFFSKGNTFPIVLDMHVFFRHNWQFYSLPWWNIVQETRGLLSFYKVEYRKPVSDRTVWRGISTVCWKLWYKILNIDFQQLVLETCCVDHWTVHMMALKVVCDLQRKNVGGVNCEPRDKVSLYDEQR